MELTVKEIRTLQLALINMEDGLNESGIAKVKELSEKLEQEVTRLTKRAADSRWAVVNCPRCFCIFDVELPAKSG